jgi:hypothetical protein
LGHLLRDVAGCYLNLLVYPYRLLFVIQDCRKEGTHNYPSPK